MSFFQEIEQAPDIEVFRLTEAYKADVDDNKVNLSVGAYRTNDGEPWVLPCVKSVELAMAYDYQLNKEYLPVTGLRLMCSAGLKLLLGEAHPLLLQNKVDAVQSLGGTGAVYLALQFLKQKCGFKYAYVSRPTWPNHKGIANLVGLAVNEYVYWDHATKSIHFDAMKRDIKNAPKGSLIILHACAHNPTGMDLSHNQWTELSDIIKEVKIFPVFDLAYQGFASGDLDKDAWAVRHFASKGMEFFVAQSFSKNFGLYNERVGNLAIITNDPLETANVKSQIKIIVRQCWSNPPQHGARIVATILNSPSLMADWKKCVASMSDRVKLMRKLLHEQLVTIEAPGNWDHIVKQSGMFSYSGLTKSQAEYMRDRYHIYLLDDGRMNMCGLTTHNVEYVAEAIRNTLLRIR